MKERRFYKLVEEDGNYGDIISYVLAELRGGNIIDIYQITLFTESGNEFYWSEFTQCGSMENIKSKEAIEEFLYENDDIGHSCGSYASIDDMEKVEGYFDFEPFQFLKGKIHDDMSGKTKNEVTEKLEKLIESMNLETLYGKYEEFCEHEHCGPEYSLMEDFDDFVEDEVETIGGLEFIQSIIYDHEHGYFDPRDVVFTVDDDIVQSLNLDEFKGELIYFDRFMKRMEKTTRYLDGSDGLSFDEFKAALEKLGCSYEEILELEVSAYKTMKLEPDSILGTDEQIHAVGRQFVIDNIDAFRL